MRHRPIVLFFVLLLGMTFVPSARAESLPTSGVFDGYYHRDAQKVGHFLYYLVAPDLHEKLAPYEGKYIRLTVDRAERTGVASPYLITKVSKIEELPAPDVKLTFITVPGIPFEGQPFAVVIKLTDRRAPNAAKPQPREFQTSVFSYAPRDLGAEATDSRISFHGYTYRQLAVYQMSGEPWQSSWHSVGGPEFTSDIGRDRIMLAPGETWTSVHLFPAGANKGDHELKVQAHYYVPGMPNRNPESRGTWIPVETWRTISVQAANAAAPASETANELAVKKLKLDHDDNGWSRLTFKLLPAGTSHVRVPVAEDSTGKLHPETYACLGGIEGFAKDHSAIPLAVERVTAARVPDGMHIKFVDLPADGVEIKAHFRKASRFAPLLDSISLNIMTDEGVKTIKLVDPYADPDLTPETPFGAIHDGVKLRARPAQSTFQAGTPLVFHFQAANTSGEPVLWWKPIRGFGENIFVEIDGKAFDLPLDKAEFIEGWALKPLVNQPREWTVTLPESTRLAKGPHTLRCTIVSPGGTYRNSEGIVPLVNGRIVSNSSAFAVK
jgi:hypothetical protein